jgi:alpha-tubulin suppressor-like RCC1 family protein
VSVALLGCNFTEWIERQKSWNLAHSDPSPEREEPACVVHRGRVYCWGPNAHGQLGLGDRKARGAPALNPYLQEVSTLSIGASANVCVVARKQVFCWGDWGEVTDWNKWTRTVPERVPLENAVKLWAGSLSCALNTTGELYCWSIRAAISTEIERIPGWPGCFLGPTDYDARCDIPQRIPIDGVVVDACTTESHVCAVTEQGRLLCWNGGLGKILGIPRRYDSAAERAQPIQVPIDPVRSISCTHRHACAVTEAGDLYCWGYGYRGALGVSAQPFPLVPQSNGVPDYASQTPTRVSLAQVRQVSAGTEHTCAVTRTGDLYCWGTNQTGQLGLGAGWTGRLGCQQEETEYRRHDRASCYSPQKVDLIHVREVHAGGNSTEAVTESGEIFQWGWLGDGAWQDAAKDSRPKRVNLAGSVR